eukprot:scaffold18324_cov176-Amphora_coffeaeformis.AAC.16
MTKKNHKRELAVLWITLLWTLNPVMALSVSLSCRLYQRILLSCGARRGVRQSLLPAMNDCIRKGRTILFSTTSSSSDEDAVVTPDESRRLLIDGKLRDLGIDADSLHSATQKAMSDPTSGYDGNFGRSAIKTYRSFLYPKNYNSTSSQGKQQLAAMAFRVAQQIDFLLKRHQSHQEEWVRHHDSGDSERNIFPMVLLLDNLRSAFNVGSIFRTADATGCAQVITTGITPHPSGNGAEKVSKSALGAEVIVPSRHFATTLEAISFFRENYPDYKLLGLETTERSLCYTNMKYPKADGVVILLGNEVTGLDTRIMPLLDGLLEIPMFGSKNSLNVANCASVVCYEIVRQWN